MPAVELLAPPPLETKRKGAMKASATPSKSDGCGGVSRLLDGCSGPGGAGGGCCGRAPPFPSSEFAMASSNEGLV